jgi:hypothetical protein
MLFMAIELCIEAFVLTLTIGGLPFAFVLLGEYGGLRLALSLFANKFSQGLLKGIGLQV